MAPRRRGAIEISGRMHLHFEHRIPRPRDAVETSLLAPDFAQRLARSGTLLVSGEEIERIVTAEAITRTAHFVFRGAVPLIGRFGSVAWRETVRWESSSHLGTFDVVPDLPSSLQARVRCRGTYALRAAGDAGAATVRVVEGTLAFDVPIVRDAVEARIATLLERLFDEEARLLAEQR